MTTEPLTIHGNTTKYSKCFLANGDVIFRKSAGADAILREALHLQHIVNSSRLLQTPQWIASGDHWLATSWLDGQNLAEQFSMSVNDVNRNALCEQFGHLLCASMAISSRLPEPNDPFESLFDRVDRFVNLDARRLITDRNTPVDGRLVGEIWADVISDSAYITPEIRYVQGDWCLPNVMTSGLDVSKMGGIVDWSEAGWMDWRFCVADGLWSIAYNSRLAGVKPDDLQRTFLAACELDYTDSSLDWYCKIRALMALI